MNQMKVVTSPGYVSDPVVCSSAAVCCIVVGFDTYGGGLRWTLLLRHGVHMVLT